MTKQISDTDIRSKVAKVAAGYLLGDLEGILSNDNGSATATIRQRYGSKSAEFIVEISRWGRLTGLTRVRDGELKSYEPTSYYFRGLSKLIDAVRVREIKVVEARVKDRVLNAFSSAGTKAEGAAEGIGESALGAGRSALAAGRSALGRARAEARPTLERVYGEVRPVADRVYGEVKPVALRAYGEVQPRVTELYGQVKPAVGRAFEDAKRWINEGSEEEPFVTVAAFADGYFEINAGNGVEILSEDIQIEAEDGGIYDLAARDSNGFFAEFSVQWIEDEGFIFATEFTELVVSLRDEQWAAVSIDGSSISAKVYEGSFVEDEEI